MMRTALQTHVGDAVDRARSARRAAHRALGLALDLPPQRRPPIGDPVTDLRHALASLDAAIATLESVARLTDPAVTDPLVQRADESPDPVRS